jgi:hypothetical protein
MVMAERDILRGSDAFRTRSTKSRALRSGNRKFGPNRGSEPDCGIASADSFFYRINNTLIGNGTIRNVVLPSGSMTDFTFPFAHIYTKSTDPSSAIITYRKQMSRLATVGLDHTLQVFVVTIAPTISSFF